MKAQSRTPHIVFAIIGGLLLILAYVLASRIPNASEEVKFWIATVQNLAFVVLTVVVVDFLWQAMGGEPVRETLSSLEGTLAELRLSVALLEDSKKTGLERLLSASAAFATSNEWMERLNSARKSIDLLGFTLHVWTRSEHFERDLADLVKSGVAVRVVIMDETNPMLPAMVNQDQIVATSVEAVKAEILASKANFRSIGAMVSGQGSFEFRTLKTGLAVTQICRTDSRLTSIQYLYSAVASRSPILDVNGADTALFQLYMQEYESLWRMATAA